MATFNSSDLLNICTHSKEAIETTSNFFVQSTPPLLEVNSPFLATGAPTYENHSLVELERNIPCLNNYVNSSLSYSFVEVKREPCQVSEVTTSSNLQSINQHNSQSMLSTMTTVVKIESTSPSSACEKNFSPIYTNNSMPVLTRKRSNESYLQTPVDVSRDMNLNYFGFRVADLGAVSTLGCSSIYSTESELMPSSHSEGLGNNIHNVNRSNSTLWQYQNTFPIESVISMSPVGLHHSRDPSKGQLVLLPSTSAIDPFQQAFLWPSCMQQNVAGSLQQTSNYAFPTNSSQTNGQHQSLTVPFQLFGPNYFTTAAAHPSSFLCQHSQVNGNRLLSISSNTKTLEQFQKANVITNHISSDKSEKSIENITSKHVGVNLNRSNPFPIPHEQSQITISNPIPALEPINMQMTPLNLMKSFEGTPPTPQPMSEEVTSGVYKNSAFKVSACSEISEMQDVNTQTDITASSEDDHISSPKNNLYILKTTEKNDAISTFSHSNKDGYENPKELNSPEFMKMYSDGLQCSKSNASYTTPICNLGSNITPQYELFESDHLFLHSSADPGDKYSKSTTNPCLLEMSGLELLSNISTGSFSKGDSFKAVNVKQEHCEKRTTSTYNECLNDYESFALDWKNCKPMLTEKNEIRNSICDRSPRNEPLLGGLNLLCALAEQRIHEEVETKNYNKTKGEHNLKTRKTKRKHSKSKSNWNPRRKKNKKKHSKQCKEAGKDVGDNFKDDSDPLKLKNWSDTEDFFKAMESDMRMRLTDITRQYKKKKRRLDEICKVNKIKKKKSLDYKFANISCKNPSFICFLDKFPTTSVSCPHSTNIHKCEGLPLIVQAKSKIDEVETSENQEALEKNSFTSKFDTRKPNCISEKKGKKGKEMGVPDYLKSRFLPADYQKQIAEDISNQNEVEKKIDKKLVLTNEHLYRKETRVLTDMGGLFYAGILKPLQPPDVYAISLDGERGNKSHIMSREEIFKDTILEVTPKSIKNVPTGTRLCAYWSQQYRCLYPGKAIDSSLTDPDFISVEFDDGDSGRIRLENIRFLLSDYPIVEYNEKPFNYYGKQNKSSTLISTATDTRSKKETAQQAFVQDVYGVIANTHKNENDNALAQKVTSSSVVTNCNYRHKKHKKRNKHIKRCHKISINPTHNDDHTRDIKPVNDSTLSSIDKKCNVRQNVDNESIAKVRNQNLCKNSTEELQAESMTSRTDGLDCGAPILSILPRMSHEKKAEKIDHKTGKGSKIAAFLPKRQLWGWFGQAYRKSSAKGRARKQFYRTITRGKENISVGECAVFLSTGQLDRPYIGRVEAMWETTSNHKVVRVRWFYHPEETIGCPKLKYPGGLFSSPHEDENDVQTISHRCEVIEFSLYAAQSLSKSDEIEAIYENNDTYYLSGHYNPKLQILKLQPDVPIEEAVNF